MSYLNILKRNLGNLFKKEETEKEKIQLIGNKNDLLTKIRMESSGTAYAYKVNLAFNYSFQEDLSKIKKLINEGEKTPKQLKQAGSALSTNLISLALSIETINR